MANKTSLRTVVNQVTKEKLAWLDSQRSLLNNYFQPILDKCDKPENRASLQFLREIHETLKKCPGSLNAAITETKDLTVFLNWINAENPDDVIYFGTEQLVSDWIQMLIKKIKFQIEKCEYSCLYANVMTQYMDTIGMDADGDDSGVDDLNTNKDSLSDKEKTIQKFCDRIFYDAAPKNFSAEKFENFLNSDQLFNMTDTIQKECLLKSRKDVASFCEDFPKITVSARDLQFCIDSLLADDLLGSEKAVTLKELKENSDALKEVCTLLTNRLSNFKEWTWPEPIHVDFRRNIAGRYRAYMDEDIVTALYLQYVGAKWAILLKAQFNRIYSSKMWKRGIETEGDLYYKSESIEGYRRKFHAQSFLSILPRCMENVPWSSYDNDSSINYTETCPIKIKQKLLHIISNEIQLNAILRPETPLTVVQTDMEWVSGNLCRHIVIRNVKFFFCFSSVHQSFTRRSIF